MAKQRITSRPSWFGYTYYYDEKGKCIGKSRPGAFGSTLYFDKRGRYAGTGRKGFLVKEVFHDKDFKRSIKTYEGILGESYYENGRLIGHSMPGWLGTGHLTLETEDPEFSDDVWVEEDVDDQDYLLDDEEYTEEDIDVEEDPIEEDFQEETNRDTVVRNVIIFTGCVLVCAVIIAFVSLRR